MAVSRTRVFDWRLLLVLAGIGAYLLLFYATELPSISEILGFTFRRADLLLSVWAFDIVIEQWTAGDVYVLDRIPILTGAVAIHLIALAIGWWLVKLAKADVGLTPLELFVFAGAIGVSAVSLYTLLAGLAGLAGSADVIQHRGWFLGPLLLIAALAAGRWLWMRRSVRSADDSTAADGAADPQVSVATGGIGPRWLWFAAPFVAVTVLGGMLPPLDFDVREYHLQAPKEFYQQGRIDFVRHNVYANMALGSQMLSLLAMVAAGDWWTGALIGKTAIALLTPLTALALLAAGRRFVSTSCGVVAALLYVSTPWIVRVSTSGLVEGASAHFMLLAVYGVLLCRNAPPQALPGRMLLAGFLAGSAVSQKYPAVLFVLLPLVVWILFQWMRAPRPRPVAAAPWLFALAAIAACGPWFAKNWVLTGNPTYPLLAGVFEDATGTRSTDLIDRWNAAHRPDDYTVGDFAGRCADVLWRSEWLSPLLAPLALLGLFFWRRPPGKTMVVPLVCYLVFVFLAWWLLTHRIDRFWVPTIAPAALLAGIGAEWSSGIVWRRTLMVLLVACLTGNLITVTVRGPGNYNRYFVALDSLRVDPLRVDPWHLRLNRMHAEQTAAGAGLIVLSVGDAQVFDLELHVLYETVFDPCWLERLVQNRSPAEIRDELRRLGVTHVFVHWGEIARYRSPGNYGYSDFVQPAVFQDLVAAGVLRPPLPPVEGHPGAVYPVAGAL